MENEPPQRKRRRSSAAEIVGMEAVRRWNANSAMFGADGRSAPNTPGSGADALVADAIRAHVRHIRQNKGAKFSLRHLAEEHSRARAAHNMSHESLAPSEVGVPLAESTEEEKEDSDSGGEAVGGVGNPPQAEELLEKPEEDRLRHLRRVAHRNMYSSVRVQSEVRVASLNVRGPDDPRVNFVVNKNAFAFAPRSLGMCDETSRVRHFCVWLVTHPWFDRLILLAILLNTVTLSLADYSVDAVDPATGLPDPDRSVRNRIGEVAEPIFLGVFFVECVLKIVAMGFFADYGSYLRSPWNVLDFVVVVAGAFSLIPGLPNITALRALRLLRPLRSLSVMRGVRALVASLFQSGPQLLNIIGLLGFVLFLFAILGIQLWAGLLHARCRMTERPIAVPLSHLVLPEQCYPQYGLSGEACAKSLDGTGPVVHPLYFEMVDRYADPPVQIAHPVTGETVWIDPPGRYYVTYAESVAYMRSLVTDRSVFPTCGTATSPAATSNTSAVVPDWYGDPSTKNTARRRISNTLMVQNGIHEKVRQAFLTEPTSNRQYFRGKALAKRLREVVAPQTLIRRLQRNTDGLATDEDDWTKSTSPWSEPRQCVWPLDASDLFQCSPQKLLWSHECTGTAKVVAVETDNSSSATYIPADPRDLLGVEYDGVDAQDPQFARLWRSEFGSRTPLPRPRSGISTGSYWTTLGNTSLAVEFEDSGDRFCGSNWDASGNERFTSSRFMGLPEASLEFSWGELHFDDLGHSLITIFQAVTLEGWTQTMYRTMDVYHGPVAAIAFVILIAVGSICILNLVLAVLWDSYASAQRSDRAAKRRRHEVLLAIERKEQAEREARRTMYHRELRRLRGESVTPSPTSEHRNLADPDSPPTMQRPARVLGQRRHRWPSNAAPSSSRPSNQTPSIELPPVGTHVAEIDEDHNSMFTGVTPTPEPQNVVRVQSVVPDHHNTGREPAWLRMLQNISDFVFGFGGGLAIVRHGHHAAAERAAAAGRVPRAPRPRRRDDAEEEIAKEAAGTAAPPPLQTSSPFVTTAHLPQAASARTRRGSSTGLPSVRRSIRESSVPNPSDLLENHGRVNSSFGSDQFQKGISAKLSMRSSTTKSKKIRLKSSRGNKSSFLSRATVPIIDKGKPIPNTDAPTKEALEWMLHDASISINVARARTSPAGLREQEAWLFVRSWGHYIHYSTLHMLSSGWFVLFISILIIANTLLLAVESYPSDPEQESLAEQINFALTLVFILEAAVKLIALGFRQYVHDRFNQLDLGIVILSIVELTILPPPFLFGNAGTSSAGAVSALRSLRLIRIFKLARSWVSLRVLLATILRALRDVRDFSILLVLFLLIFALLGRVLFANRFRFDPRSGEPVELGTYGFDDARVPRLHFDDLLSAVMSVFALLTLEDGPSVLLNGWRTRGAVGVVYYVSAIAFGNMILLSLFLAVLLSGFEGMEAKMRRARGEHAVQVESDTDASESTDELLDDDSDDDLEEGDVTDSGTVSSLRSSKLLSLSKRASNASERKGKGPSPDLVKHAAVNPRLLEIVKGYSNKAETHGGAENVEEEDLSEAGVGANWWNTLVMNKSSSIEGTGGYLEGWARRHTEAWEALGRAVLTSAVSVDGGTVTPAIASRMSSDSPVLPRRPGCWYVTKHWLRRTYRRFRRGLRNTIAALHDRQALNALKKELRSVLDKVPRSLVRKVEEERVLAAVRASLVRGLFAPDVASVAGGSIALHRDDSRADSRMEIGGGVESFEAAASGDDRSEPRRRSRDSPEPISPFPIQTHSSLLPSIPAQSPSSTQKAVRIQVDPSPSSTTSPTKQPQNTSSSPPTSTRTTPRVRAPPLGELVRRGTTRLPRARSVRINNFNVNTDLSPVAEHPSHGDDSDPFPAGSSLESPAGAGVGLSAYTAPASTDMERHHSLRSTTSGRRNPQKIQSGEEDDKSSAAAPDSLPSVRPAPLRRMRTAVQLPGAMAPSRDAAIQSSIASDERGANAVRLAALERKMTRERIDELARKRRNEDPLPEGTIPLASVDSMGNMGQRGRKTATAPAPRKRVPRPTMFSGTSNLAVNLNQSELAIPQKKPLDAEDYGEKEVMQNEEEGLPREATQDEREFVEWDGIQMDPSDYSRRCRLAVCHWLAGCFALPPYCCAILCPCLAIGRRAASVAAWRRRRRARNLARPSVGTETPGLWSKASTLRGPRRVSMAFPPRLDDDNDSDDVADAAEEAWGAQDAVRPCCGGGWSKERALCLCPTRDRHPRKSAVWITRQSWFDPFILFLILVSCIALALDSPLLDPSSTLSQALFVMDIILTVLFSLEALIKITAFGFMCHHGSYLHSAWNMLDLTLVAISIFALLSEASSAGSLRALRALRALRPLRVIARAPGLRLVVNALLLAVPAIFNVLIVCILFLFIFAVVVVNNFKGSLYHCTGPIYDSLSPQQRDLIFDPIPFQQLNSTLAKAWAADPIHHPSYQGERSKAVCEWMGASWERVIPQSYDNVPAAIGTLFEMSSTEGWLDIAFASIDSRGLEMQPRRNASEGWIVFFIFFMIVGSFFLVNLFVGVVIDSFTQQKEEAGGNSLLTEAQKEWAKVHDALMTLEPETPPQAPRSEWRAQIFYLVTASWFDPTILFLILANAVVMAMVYFGMPESYAHALEVLNVVFAGIFFLEAVLKIAGLGWKTYWRSSWNRFDFIVVLGTTAGITATYAGGLAVGSVATLVRTFRLARILRVLHSARGLRVLFSTIVTTLPALASIGGLLLLLLFIFAIVGVQLFAHVQFSDELDGHANFRTLGTAILTLLRCATGENYNSIMHALAARQPGCTDQPEWNDSEPRGCGTPTAYAYFYTFMVVVSFVMLNQVIAVLLEGFADSTRDEDARLSKRQLERFATAWATVDPLGTMFIPASQLPMLLRRLSPPLGLGAKASSKEVREAVISMPVPTYGDSMVAFFDVARACAKRAIASSAGEKGQALGELPEDHHVNRKWRNHRSKMHDAAARRARELRQQGRLFRAQNVGERDAPDPTLRSKASFFGGNTTDRDGNRGFGRRGRLLIQRLTGQNPTSATVAVAPEEGIHTKTPPNRTDSSSDKLREQPWDIRHVYATAAIADTFRTFRFRWRLAQAMERAENETTKN